MKEKILVTSALTYANGKLHIGHVAGSYLNADVFVRFQKLLENDVIYIGGSDDHGAPISIVAEKENTSPQEIANRYNKSIKESLAGLNIQLDNFSGTSHKEHHKLSQEFFLNLLENGYITKKTTKQFYDKKFKRFLPDRYVEGVCPYCGAEGARGDQCDNCGKLIDALTLKNPISKISGEPPIIKETSHWYLNLPKFEPKLRKWLETKTYWKDNVLNFILSWLDEGLIERSITRDLDWGVPVPLPEAEGKVLYVWFDAPIGYISSTKEWAIKKGTFVFSQKYFDGTISKPQNLSDYSKEVLEEAKRITIEIADSYKNYKVRKAAKTAMDIARLGNKYFDETQPWKTVKEDKTKAAETLYVCAELLRKISIVFAPIIPKSMQRLRKMLNLPEKSTWKELENSLTETQLGKIEPLFRKITDEEIETQIKLLQNSEKKGEKISHKTEIEYDDFGKLELRIVKIISAEIIPKSSKLLKLKIKMQSEEREIVAGIKQSYKPEELVGKKVALLANLKPRKVMG
ncbi:MAG: hypothetical protein B6D62_02000, partial [Candidatus Cloacimonas sp. 4484_275]